MRSLKAGRLGAGHIRGLGGAVPLSLSKRSCDTLPPSACPLDPSDTESLSAFPWSAVEP
jgi:hypothetical protein